MLLGAAIIAILSVFLFFDPYPQPVEYFAFADQRNILGVPNFWNVVSNFAFLIPGFCGLRYLFNSRATGVAEKLRPAYLILFIGVVMTAFGSAWFHYAPANESLVWDRLPMTIVFMSLFAIVIAEFISPKLGRIAFIPFLAIGIFSVYHWSLSEASGNGDLRLYALVQFLPMFLIPAIAWLYESNYDRSGYLFGMYVFYALAKLAEFLDVPIYNAGNIVSGHSVKHVLAAGAAIILWRGIKTRRELVV